MAQLSSDRFRNRIVGEGTEAPDQLLANPRNWRIHPKNQQDALRATLDNVGWVQRVIVNQQTGHVVDGHLRVALAISEQEPSVPVLYVDLTPEEEGVVLATLDPIGAMAATDKDMLADLLTEVDADPLHDLLASVAEQTRVQFRGGTADDPGSEVDRAEELRAKWQTERGQLWLIREHRLLCGDATDSDDVARLLAGNAPHLCVTDPPYGVNYDPAWRQRAAEEGLLWGPDAKRRLGVFTNDDRADWSDAWRLFPGDVIYTWHPAGATSLEHAHALQATGFDLRMQVIWAKSNFPIGRGDYHVRHEPCWYAVRHGKPSLRTDDRTQTTLWEIPLDHNVDGGHSTQKPLECMARPIRNHSGDVYDPFVGSGTTLVAAETLGRRGYAMDIAPEYVAVTLERLCKMGLEPRLA